MAKKRTRGFGRALDRISRAFASKDDKAFDAAMDNLEELAEAHDDEEEEEPDTIEVHNHIPDSMMRDTARGELPEKDAPGFDRRGHDSRDNEMPPWFKEHKEATDAALKRMSDALEELKGDRRHDDRRHDDEELPEEFREHEGDPSGEDNTATEENLEMDRHRDRRHDDRRGRDEPSEREEMAERIRENGSDRRGSDRRDEANKEILGELQFEAPPGTGVKDARSAKDSRYLEEAFQDTLAKAEVLAPGIMLPTFDRAAAPLKTLGQIIKLRKTALDLAYSQPATRGHIDSAMSGRALDTKGMRFGALRVLFNAAAVATAQGNNRRATDRSHSFETNGIRNAPVAGIQSVADINKRNRDFYAKH